MKKIVKKILSVLLILVLLPVASATILITTLAITEHRPDEVELTAIANNQTTRVPLNQSIKVMTFNTGYSALSKDEDFVMDGGKKTRPDSMTVIQNNLTAIKQVVSSQQANILFLQEVDISSKRSYFVDQLKAYETLLDHQSISYAPNFRVLFVPFPFSIGNMIGKVESGIVTASSYEVSSAARIQLPGEFAWPVRLANLKRALLVFRLPIEGSDKELILINGHLSAYDDGTMRSQEMNRLREFMIFEYQKGNYIVVGGDFNQTFPEADGVFPIVDSTYYVAPVIADDFLPEGFSFVIDLTLPTCRLLDKPYNPLDPLTQYYLIDGFIVSSNIQIQSVSTLNLGFENSDHNPVTMEIVLLP